MAIMKQQSTPPPHQQVTMTPARSRKTTAGVGGGKDVKQRVNTYMNKLSDRDTEAMAASQLESMARALPADSLPSFLSAISDTRPSDKTPLRRHCLRLLSLLSLTQPPQALTPFLPRMLAAVIRRIRDADSSVRSACVDAVRDMCSSSYSRAGGDAASSSFCSVFLKPLSECLLLEQDHNAQMGLALCLAAAVDQISTEEDGVRGARNQDLVQHLHRLVPRLVRLAKSNGFKTKPALISLLGSIVSAGGASTSALLAILVPCLADFLSCDDWAARKAAAEALTLVAAIPELHLLVAFKASYLSSFHARRFDKVKIVRESMNQMLEAWKDVPSDLEDEASDRVGNTPPSLSQSNSIQTENMNDGWPLGSVRVCSSERSTSPLTAKTNRSPVKKSSPADASSTPAGRNTLPRSDKRMNRPLFRKFDHKKPSDWKVEIAIPHAPPAAVGSDNGVKNDKGRDGRSWDESMDQENCGSKLTKRLVFESTESEGRMNKIGHLKSGSRVIPLQEKKILDDTVENDGFSADSKDSDLSVIRKQLVQIENQQSSLLDLLQHFIGNAQSGIQSLETRVHGLEMALDELSHDLAVSCGRTSTVYCCKLPGAAFLSSKFWRRTEERCSSKLTMPPKVPLVRVQNSTDNVVDSLKGEEQIFRRHGGFVVNPLAEGNTQSRSSEAGYNRMLKSIMNEPGSWQAHDISRIDGTSTITTSTNTITRSALGS